jgi:class 3 adenylate cyclase
MNDRTNRTVICSIVFLDIVDYSKRVGQEQLVLKERFNGLIAEVIRDIAQNDRVLIDTGDGVALCFMGDPEDALFVVMNLRDRLRTPENQALGLTVRIGINLGPVRLIHDINDRPNVIGDGINVAQRVMSFAEPNQIMVSRSYYEVVSRLSQEYTRLFNYAGARTDKHVREHEVYAVGPGQEEQPKAIEEPALVAPTISPPPPPPPPERTTTAATAASPASVPAPSRSNWLIPGAVAVAVVLAVAIFAGMQLKSNKAGSAEPTEAAAGPAAVATAPAATAVMSAPVAIVPAAASAPTVAAATPQPAAVAPAAKADAESKSAATKTKGADADPTKAPPTVVAQKATTMEPAATKKNEAHKDNVAKADTKGATGTLEFWISPYGDVFIDGKQAGTAPPLKTYKVPVGSHKVEVINDNAGFPYAVNVEVKADEVVRVNKSFPAAR